MLQVGSRSYQLVRAHSGFGVVVGDADIGFAGPERGRLPRVLGPGKHSVTLETAWRVR